MRKKLAVANWKMNKTRTRPSSFAKNLDSPGTTAWDRSSYCPPYTYLDLIAEQMGNTSVSWGGQNCFGKSKVLIQEKYPSHVAGLGLQVCNYRSFRTTSGIRETDAVINRKMAAAFQAGLILSFVWGNSTGKRK